MQRDRATISDVARAAGVSKGTVSLVLNGRTGTIAISPPTQAIVRQAAERLGYTPNAAAKALRSHRSQVITLLLATLVNPYFTDIAAAAQAAAAARSFALHIVDGSRPSVKRQALDALQGGGSDGVIVATGVHSTRDEDLSVLQGLAQRGIPAVLVLDHSPAALLPAVRIDNEAGAYLAVQHLLRLGHRRIAYLLAQGNAPLLEDQTSRGERYRGYRRAMQEASAPIDPGWLPPLRQTTPAGGQEGMQLLLAAPSQRPTAVVTMNDLSAIGALRAVREAKLRVPDDVAVVGFGGIALGAFTVPALSTVEHPRAELGRLGVETLCALLDGQQPATIDRVLPVHMLVRESCGGATSPAALAM